MTSLRMDTPVLGRPESRPDHQIGTVRRRRIVYVEGYDPRGAEAYHQMFQRSCERFSKTFDKTWLDKSLPVSLALGTVEIDSEDLAHWSLELRSANWQVATRYDFLRLERHIRADMGGPLARQIPRALGWIIDDLTSGAQWRIFRASWLFGLHLLSIQLLLLVWLALSVAFGLAALRIVVTSLAQPMALGVVAAMLAAPAALLALKPLAHRWFVNQITNCWATLRRFGRGQPTWLDPAIEAGARHLVAVARANDADELVVVGHSTGSVIAAAIVARALTIDPDLGRRGSRLVLLTLGSVMPAVALHPAATRMRDIIKRLAAEPTLAWIECQSRKDVMNFADFDPVEGVGVHVDQHRNPLIWPVRFKDMVSPAYYRRLRWNFFRMHFQYIMAGDRPTTHDYVLLVGGPMALADWAEHHDLAFLRDGMTPGISPCSDAGASRHR
jgi:pimeloyl-ACP methyl ester carboxylesterase